MDDIVTRLRHAEENGICEWQVLIDAADEIERLRQGIWDACRILGMDTDGDQTPAVHAWPHLADLVVQEAQRTTKDSQEEIERLQVIEDANAAEIERLRAAGDALIAAIRNHDLREQHIKAWEARRG